MIIEKEHKHNAVNCFEITKLYHNNEFYYNDLCTDCIQIVKGGNLDIKINFQFENKVHIYRSGYFYCSK